MKCPVKLVVMYPRPKDIDAFEYVYNKEHVPMAVENLSGKTKIVATKVLSSPLGTPAFHRVAEVYFPSLKALEECAASEGGKLTIVHAFSISSGGPRLSSWPRKKRSCFRKTKIVRLDPPYVKERE